MRRIHRRFFIVFCLAFLFGLTGCTSDRSAEQAGQTVDRAIENTSKNIEKAGDAVANKAEQAGDYLGDAAITAKVKAEILSDPLLKVAQIEVTTTNGVVKLSGRVDSQLNIDRAVTIVRSLKDVKSVDSALVY